MEFKGNVVKLKDTVNISAKDNLSPMIKMDSSTLKVEYKKNDMRDLYGNDMYARAKVVEKICEAQKILEKRSGDLQLFVFYAYRSPDIQKKYYERSLLVARETYPELNE